MRLKFWDRTPRQPQPDFTATDASQAAALQRLARAKALDKAADELLRKSDRTIAVNGFGDMIASLYGEHPRRKP